MKLGSFSLRKNSVSSARGTNLFVRACTCEWSRHQSRPLLELINSSALLLSFGDPQGTRIALPGPSVADENRRYCGTLSNHSIPGQDREVQVSVLTMVVSELTTAARDQSGR